jgi:chemotaxis-related protein WspB
MLFLICQCGDERFAIQGDRVMEVLPMVEVHPMGGTSPVFAGVIPYRGISIPVIDLCLWRAGRPAAARLSTRIIVLSLAGEGGREVLAGLLAERATEMMRLESSVFGRVESSGAGDVPSADVAWDPDGALLRLDLDRLAALLHPHPPSPSPHTLLAP